MVVVVLMVVVVVVVVVIGMLRTQSRNRVSHGLASGYPRGECRLCGWARLSSGHEARSRGDGQTCGIQTVGIQTIMALRVNPKSRQRATMAEWACLLELAKGVVWRKACTWRESAGAALAVGLRCGLAVQVAVP